MTETKNGIRGVIISAGNDELHRRKILVHVQSDNVVTEGGMLEKGDLFKHCRVCDKYESDVLSYGNRKHENQNKTYANQNPFYPQIIICNGILANNI